MTSSRFVIAVHLLTLIEHAGGEPVTSEYSAGSITTNPAFVRRIAMSLRSAGLLTAQLGAGGGMLLARRPDAITLLDIHRAVETQELFAMHREGPNAACDVGGNIQQALGRVLDAAQSAMERELASVTLADVARDVRRVAKRRARQG